MPLMHSILVTNTLCKLKESKIQLQSSFKNVTINSEEDGEAEAESTEALGIRQYI